MLCLQGFGDTSDRRRAARRRAPSPEDQVEQHERIGYLIDAVAELPERLRVVVEDYFLAERPMAEIADELGVTESRVSQMRAEALVLLRTPSTARSTPSWSPPHARPDGLRRPAPRGLLRRRRRPAARRRPRLGGMPAVDRHRLILSIRQNCPRKFRQASSPRAPGRTGSATEPTDGLQTGLIIQEGTIMGLRINQNIDAINSYRNLSVTQGQMSKSLEKLSSGFRINRAADDAAGLAISEGLRSQVGGLKVGVRNAQDGISRRADR